MSIDITKVDFAQGFIATTLDYPKGKVAGTIPKDLFTKPTE